MLNQLRVLKLESRVLDNESRGSTNINLTNLKTRENKQ